MWVPSREAQRPLLAAWGGALEGPGGGWRKALELVRPVFLGAAALRLRCLRGCPGLAQFQQHLLSREGSSAWPQGLGHWGSAQLEKKTTPHTLPLCPLTGISLCWKKPTLDLELEGSTVERVYAVVGGWWCVPSEQQDADAPLWGEARLSLMGLWKAPAALRPGAVALGLAEGGVSGLPGLAGFTSALSPAGPGPPGHGGQRLPAGQFPEQHQR